MAVVFTDIGSVLGLKKLFGEAAKGAEEFAAAAKAAQELAAAAKAAAEEYAAAVKAAEECAAAAKAAKEMAVAIHRKQLYTAAAAAFEEESTSSKVSDEGVRQLYVCLCYPKELLKKEDEEQYGPHYEEWLAKVLAFKQRFDKEVLPKINIEWVTIRRYVEEVELREMFIEWATKHGKRYDGVYEWRLRYRIWLNTKERKEQLCSKSGRMFSMNIMTMAADLTLIEREHLNVGKVKPAVGSLRDVKRRLLYTMGESWMEKARDGFEEWAERHKRVYSSTEEHERRLLAYLDNMRTIHLKEKQCPGEWEYGIDLENMDKFPWEADLIPAVECSRCKPHKQPCNEVTPFL